MEKRASVAYDPVVIIIIAVVVMVILIILAVNIFGAMQEEADREGCRKSLEISTFKLEGVIDKYGNPVKLNCKTEYLKYKTQDDNEIKRIIADKMVDCWNMYLKGEKEIFNTEDNNYCVVCSRLEFEKKTELPNFSDYLNSNRVPGGGKTYLEYLAGIDVTNFQKTIYDNSDLEGKDTISTAEPLAVMFVMSKDAFPGGQLGAGTKVTSTPEGLLVGGAAGLALGVVVAVAGVVTCPFSGGLGCAVTVAAVAMIVGGTAGAVGGYMAGSDRTSDWDARILIWPYNNMNQLQCTYLESQSIPLQIKQV